MFDRTWLDDFTRQLTSGLSRDVQAVQGDIRRNLDGTLKAMLARLDLVTREEFDVQEAVLLRTRQKLEALETRIKELEAQRQAT